MRRQHALTLMSDVVEESDFSGTAYNSTHISDVQNWADKK